MCCHVDRLWVSRGVAERLHHQVGREAQAGEVFELVAGHRASGVLGADGGHLRFAVGARAYALVNRQATSLADHFLRQGEALAGVYRSFRQLEQIGRAQAELGTCLVGQAAADDQRDTAASANLVQQHRSFQFESGDHFVAVVLADLALVWVQVDHVTHVDVGDVKFDRQSASIFHGVVEDRGNLGAEAKTAGALVRHERNIVAKEPQYGVGRRLARRTGTDHVADVGNREAIAIHLGDLLHRADGALHVGDDAVAGHFQHRQGMQRDIRARPGIRGRGEVVGVGLARYLEHPQADLVGQGRALFEPLTVSPRLQHALGVGIAVFGFFCDVVKGIEHQQGVLELFGSDGGQIGIVQQLDQRGDVVAALHGAQQLRSVFFVDERGADFTLGEGGEETGLDVGGFVDTWWHAVGDQVDQYGFFAGRRIFQQLDQACGLFGVKRLGHDTQGGTLFNVFAVGFKHSYYPHQWSRIGTLIQSIHAPMRCTASKAV